VIVAEIVVQRRTCVWFFVSGGELGGGESAEGRVGSVRVVLDAPGFDEHLGFEQRGELLDVQQLVTDTAVEALDEGVLPR
jgi:hypothetical protein